MRSRIPLIRVALVTAAWNGGACSSDHAASTSGRDGSPFASGGGGGASAGQPNASGGVANAGSSGLSSSGGTGGGANVSGGSANAGGTPGAGGTTSSLGGNTPGTATGGLGSAPVAGTSSTGGGGGSASAGASSKGGAAGSGGIAHGGAAGTATGGVAAVDCSKLAKAPAEFETLSGFAGSEDFVFDLKGNYVGVDENENLVRITKDKKKELWAPSIGDVAGMGLLPDGSVVFCNVDKGSLQRVHANGSVTTVLGALLYPNGLDIGPDGFVYVAENGAGRVRRVNVETGEFTVVAMGLQGPNGVAFSADPKLFYVGSFEGSGVYRVNMTSPGELGQASVFARPNGSQLKEPTLACPDMQEGTPCEVPGQFEGGTCRRLANVIDCVKDTTIRACDGFDCTSAEFGGGIDGLGVDACGNVYASEFQYHNLWRVSPSGTIEKLASLPAMWIPNMKWGRGLGGFDSNVLFVADRDDGRLFAVSVGVPAAASLFGARP
jgi:sugar lactone lactonase YvrE